jgi:PRC-barrel domain
LHTERSVCKTLSVLAVLLAVALLCRDAHAQQQSPPLTTRSLTAAQAGPILGRDVFDSSGADVGLLVDVLVDGKGEPVAGVVDVGGFLGVGARRVAIAWRLLRFVHDDDETRIIMDLTFDSAAAAPEFQGPDNTVIVIDHAPP